MKKKLLCLMLILVMCFPANIALAAENVIDGDTGETVDEITTHVVTTGDDSDLALYKSYGIIIPGDTKEVVMPITFESKGILISASVSATDSESITIDSAIYADADCTELVDDSTYDYEAIIPEAGTYYLQLKVNDYSYNEVVESYEVGFASQFYATNDQTLKNKTWVCAGSIDYKTPTYYKVVVSKEGSLTINFESEYSGYITLCNSKKKAISEEESFLDGEVCFAVEKGTYYYKITNNSDLYRIKSTFATITDNSGTTQKKAKQLTAGKTFKGCLTASDKTSTVDYYKITISKSQEVSITLIGDVSSGSINYEFYGNNISGSISGSISTLNDDESFSAETWSSTELPKGTYYIKLYKDNSKTSGTYSIKFNK